MSWAIDVANHTRFADKFYSEIIAMHWTFNSKTIFLMQDYNGCTTTDKQTNEFKKYDKTKTKQFKT